MKYTILADNLILTTFLVTVNMEISYRLFYMVFGINFFFFFFPIIVKTIHVLSDLQKKCSQLFFLFVTGLTTKTVKIDLQQTFFLFTMSTKYVFREHDNLSKLYLDHKG